MTKWEKIKKAFDKCDNEESARALAKELTNDNTLIYVEAPCRDNFLHATGAANRLYQRTMIQGWNQRNGKPGHIRQMQVFI